MAFITYSVGVGGKNNASDVKIIQWMLKRAQMFYSTNIFSREYMLEESGALDLETVCAIYDFISFRIRNRFDHKLQKMQEKNLEFIKSFPVPMPNTVENKYIISPDDGNYNYLLRCSLNPVCEVNGQPKGDFSSDPLAIMAFRGTIGFYNFKTAAEAMNNKPCAEQKYGINIVTNTPYVALGFNASELQRIQKGYYDVLNATCSNAYIRNNLPTPAQVFQHRGVVFLHNDLLDLSIPKEMKQLGFDESNWIDFRIISNTKAKNMDAFTLGIDRKGGWGYTPAITIFRNVAFNEVHFSFDEIFAHETIHRSGVGDKFGCTFCLKSHDLAIFPPYEEILTNCGCAKEKIR